MLSWLRNLLRGERVEDSAPRRVRTRVVMPLIHEVPERVLRVLRAVDDRLDVYFVRGGDGWLLQYQEDRARIVEGRKMLLEDWQQERESGEVLEFNVSAHLMAQGFALLAIGTFHEAMSAGWMERTAQRVLARTDADIMFDQLQRRAEADSSAQALRGAALLSDRIRSDVKSDYALAYRGRRNFTSRRSYR